MNEPPFFSIIIPVYYVEHYIRRCLKSLVDQTYGNFEALCVCDASSDQSIDIVDTFCQQDSRFHFLEGTGSGLSTARNIGMDASCGNYICFLDADDYYSDNALDVLHQEIIGSAPDILVFGAVAFPKRPHPQKWLERTLSTCNRTYDNQGVRCLFENRSAMPFVWRNCYRSTFLRTHSVRFDPALRVAEDVAFQMDAFPLAERIRFISRRLYFYQWYRENSLQQLYSRESYVKLFGHLQVVDHVLQAWSPLCLVQKYRFELAIWLLNFIFGYALRYLPPTQRHEIEKKATEAVNAILSSEDLILLPFFSRAQYDAVRTDDFSFGGVIGKIRYHMSKLVVKHEW